MNASLRQALFPFAVAGYLLLPLVLIVVAFLAGPVIGLFISGVAIVCLVAAATIYLIGRTRREQD